MGTLRDQVIYPDTLADMKAKAFTDDDIFQILTVRLGNFPVLFYAKASV